MRKTLGIKSVMFFALALLMILSVTSQGRADDGVWESKSPISESIDEIVVANINGVLYRAGGWNICTPSGMIESYNPSENTWAQVSSLTHARGGAVGEVLDGKLYIAGGQTCCGCSINSVEVYEPGLSAPAGLNPMHEARVFAKSGVVNNVLYVFGGVSGGMWTTTVEAYDPSTGIWSYKADMPQRRGYFTAATLNGLIYLMGGYNSTTNERVFKVDVYDPVTNTWNTNTDVSPILTCRVFGAAAVSYGKIYLLGGSLCDGYPQYNDQVEVYNPKTNIWSTLPSLPTPRMDLGFAAIGNALYTVGGSFYGPSYTNAVEVFRIPYSFSGFLPPVNIDKPFKLGSTVPIKFRLIDTDGNFIPDAIAKLQLRLYTNDEPAGDPIIPSATGNSDSGNTFKYNNSDNTYIFNLSTKGLSTGSYQLSVYIDDKIESTFISLK